MNKQSAGMGKAVGGVGSAFGGLLDALSKTIGGGFKKHPLLAPAAIAGGIWAAPKIKEKLFGPGTVGMKFRDAPEAQFGGFDPHTARNLYSAMTAAGIRRRQMQNTVDYMNEMYGNLPGR